MHNCIIYQIHLCVEFQDLHLTFRHIYFF